MFPLVTILIYSSGAGFPGWNFFEVLLIQGIFTLSVGLSKFASNGMMYATIEHVREGTFEVVFLKPLDPILYLMAMYFDLETIGLVLGGVVLTAISLAHAGIASLLAIPQFLLLFIAGFAVMTGMSMLMAATSFKWVGNYRIPEIFDSVLSFGKYPLAIFPNVIQGLATFVIPVGMVGFFPAQALLGTLSPVTLIAVAPCILFMLFGIWIYKQMIKRYEGVGG
jgi:ABC-2 type transport system permease protein